MSIDLQRISPAPWTTNMLTIHPAARIEGGPTEQWEVVDGDFDPQSDTFSNFLKIVARCDCTKGKFETEQANAEFIAIARNAFDVMMRRSWHAIDTEGGWEVMSGDGCWWGSGPAPSNQTWPDPFTALVEADAWYRKNVEVA